MIKFEKAKGWEQVDINLPVRKTAKSAGYDFEVAEDIVIPSYYKLMQLLGQTELEGAVDLKALTALTSSTKAKPTLVPTGVKCSLAPDTYLELSVRSSSPLKYWLILANSVGIIDADYYSNPDNDGAIFFQLINLSPFDITLHKGDIIGQGIIKHYLTTDDDSASGDRLGGFGSTTR